MKIHKITNVGGGVVTLYPSEMKDNQFEVIKNMTYDKDKRLRSRGGLKAFGSKSPNNKPFSSIFFFQNDSTFERNLFGVAGDVFYKYDEDNDSWIEIKTGLKEYEKDGKTRTKWSFAVYQNVVYMCDGVNPYASYDGKTYTEHTNQPKCRYIEYMSNIMFGAGDDDHPSKLYWSEPLAANANVINFKSFTVGGDELGKINGLKEMGRTVLVFKNKKIYEIDILTPKAMPLDVFNGGYADRTIKQVGGSLFYQSDIGINNLQSRQATVGGVGLETKTKTENLRKITDRVKTKNFNSSVASYISNFTNYYYSFDTNGDNVANETLVYSSTMGSWVSYDYPSLYDYGFYIDKNGDYHYLISPDNGGQLLEIEKTLNDNGNAIYSEIKSKKWDFGEISLSKTFQNIDVTGLKSKKGKIKLEVFVDDELVQEGIITDDNIKMNSGNDILMGVSPIGVNAIGGGGGKNKDETIELYRYIVRLPMYETGINIQIKMSSEEKDFIWTYEGCNIGLDADTFNFIDESFII